MQSYAGALAGEATIIDKGRWFGASKGQGVRS
jgi:hypothetical protein